MTKIKPVDKDDDLSLEYLFRKAEAILPTPKVPEPPRSQSAPRNA